METLELIFSGVGVASTGLFLIRFVMMFVGGFGDEGDFGGDSDFDAGVDADGQDLSLSGDLNLVSVYTVTAFLMIGSWTGLLVLRETEGSSTLVQLAGSFGAAFVSGFVMMYIAAWLMMKLKGLAHDGTLRHFDAKGLRGEVYARIPAAGEGEGQVRVEVKGRLKIFRAVNEDDSPIDSFKPVTVTGMTTDHVMRVRHTG